MADRKKRPLLPHHEHRAGCPQEPDRTESWEAKRTRDGKTVRIIRCIDCGAQVAEDAEGVLTRA